jgi:hypothetical protein
MDEEGDKDEMQKAQQSFRRLRFLSRQSHTNSPFDDSVSSARPYSDNFDNDLTLRIDRASSSRGPFLLRLARDPCRLRISAAGSCSASASASLNQQFSFPRGRLPPALLFTSALSRAMLAMLPILSLLSLTCGASAPRDVVLFHDRSSSKHEFQPARSSSKTRTIFVDVTHTPSLIIAKHVGTWGLDTMNASTITLSGAVARIPFDVQPEIKVLLLEQEARQDAKITVEFEDNPTCGILKGQLSARIVNGIARFTDLSISEHGRDYSLRFCFGECRGVSTDVQGKDILDVVTPQFAVRYGRLILAQSVGSAIAGETLQPQPTVRVERERNGDWVVAHDFDFSVVAHYHSPHGRSTVWAKTGIVQFTDLKIDLARPSTKIVFTSCAGSFYCPVGATDAMAALDVFDVRHSVPVLATIEHQPVRVQMGGEPLGSVCVQWLGETCKVFKTVRPVEVHLLDKFDNRCNTNQLGTWIACAELLRQGKDVSRSYLAGTLLESFNAAEPFGVVRFSDLKIVIAGSGYTLNISVHDGSCDTPAQFSVITSEFDINATMISAIGIIRQPGPLHEKAGETFTIKSEVAFQDFEGNIIPDGNNLTISVEFHNYTEISLPPPGDWSDLARNLGFSSTNVSLTPMLYSSSCVDGVSVLWVDRFVRQSTSDTYQTVSDKPESCIRQELSQGGIVRFTDLSFRRMGWYTLRFYGWAHVAITAPFYVENAGVHSIHTLRSPLGSSCSGISTLGQECRLGGLLHPQPVFGVQDRFGNWYIDGQSVFRIVLFTASKYNGKLLCDQRPSPSIDSCQAKSSRGYVVFTDLRIDTSGTDYYFRLDWEDKAYTMTKRFSVYSAEDFVAVKMPPYNASSACLLTPQPTFRIPGVQDMNNIVSYNQVPIYGAVASAAIIKCVRTVYDITVMNTGDSDLIANAFIRDKVPFNGKPSYRQSNGGYSIYFCTNFANVSSAAERVRCTQPFWAISRGFGACSLSSSEILLYSCQSVQRPYDIGERGWLSTRADSFSPVVKVSRKNETCLQDSGGAKGFLGNTTATMLAGKVEFTNLAIAVAGYVTVRYSLLFEGSSYTFTVDSDFQVLENDFKYAAVMQQPSDTPSNNTLDRYPIVRLFDWNNFPITGWNCMNTWCESEGGHVTVTAGLISFDPRPAILTDLIFEELSTEKALKFSFVPVTANEAYTVEFLGMYKASCEGSSRQLNATVRTMPFKVFARKPSELRVLQQPPRQLKAGLGFSISAALYDTVGNLIPATNTTVAQIAISEGPEYGSLHGACGRPLLYVGQCSSETDIIMIIASSGAIEYRMLALKLPGNYKIQITAIGFTAISESIQILPGRLEHSRIRMVVQPVSLIKAGQRLEPPPIFEIVDEFDTRITTVPNITVNVWWKQTTLVNLSPQIVEGSLIAVKDIVVTDSDLDVRMGNIEEVPAEPLYLMARMSSSETRNIIAGTWTSSVSVQGGNASNLMVIDVPSVVLAGETFFRQIV